MEPWGLVVNEAAACGLPLLVSDRAGCAETLAIEGRTGRRFDPADESAIREALTWIASMPRERREELGRAAAENAAAWGPGRFAEGTCDAIRIALDRPIRPHRGVGTTTHAAAKEWQS